MASIQIEIPLEEKQRLDAYKTFKKITEDSEALIALLDDVEKRQKCHSCNHWFRAYEAAADVCTLCGNAPFVVG